MMRYIIYALLLLRGSSFLLPSPTRIRSSTTTTTTSIAAAQSTEDQLAAGVKKQENALVSDVTVTMKEQPQVQAQTQAQPEQNDGSFHIKPLGVVRSIYHLCIGTPRQGLLAPHGRGRIELDSSNGDIVDGLDEYSHIWIVFVFHLNTVGNSPKTKIAPPALGGKKVGVYATRSPHRGSTSVGMTLCKLDNVETKNQKVTLHISGLDLVDGTPVLDIKPYVAHYDSVIDACVPNWVSGGLATQRSVVIAPQAMEELQEIVNDDALDFYHGNTALNDITSCIKEVLAMDVRSAWQTKKARQGKSQANRAGRVQEIESNEGRVGELDEEVCTQLLDNVLLSYTVTKCKLANRTASEGSGAEDIVTVVSIRLLSASEKSPLKSLLPSKK